MLRSATAAVALITFLVLAPAIGSRLNEWRSQTPTSRALAGVTGSSSPAAVATIRPSPAPVIARITRDDALALVRSLGEVIRVDRIDAKLMPFAEFEAVGTGVDRSGGPGHGGGTPDRVWAVAVAGDLAPNMGDRLPAQHYAWALYGINADRAQVSTLRVGTTGSWPPGFDALVDHPLVPPAPPRPTPQPVKFEHLTTTPLSMRQAIVRMAATDQDARSLWGVVTTGARDSAGQSLTALVRSDDGGASWRNVDGVTARPFDVAAVGTTVLVSDAGMDTAERGRAASGGLFASTDSGRTWRRVSADAVMRIAAFEYHGHALFVAEHWWATRGAATGPSRIFASFDAFSWREIGEVPGPAFFGMTDVALVSFSKNVPGDGIYRIEGLDLSSLQLVPVKGSVQVWANMLSGPSPSELWVPSVNGWGVRHSIDGGRTWQNADAGLAGRIAGLFLWHGAVYAIGDGAYRWDGAQWQVAQVLGPKAAAVFQLGPNVFIQGTDGVLYRSEH